MAQKFKIPLLLFVTWGAFFALLFPRIFFLTENGLFAGSVAVWADWSLHLALATIFADKNIADWFNYHPVYADGNLTYAFLTNFISGMLMRWGVNIDTAFVTPSIIYSFALIGGMFELFRRILKSAALSFVAISLFFMAAGLGFIDFLSSIKNFSFAEIWPSDVYSSLVSHQWYGSNFLIGHLIPQRALLFGMTLSLWGMVGILSALHSNSKVRIKLLLSAAAIGILPIAHMHSFIALIVIMAPLAVYYIRRWQELLWFYVPAGILSSVLYFIFISGGIQSADFMKWFPGYTTLSLAEWLWFWGKVWGAVLPLVIITCCTFWKKISLDLRCLTIGAGALFVMANLIIFQPLVWDNTKLYLWCYLIFSGLIAFLLGELWNNQAKYGKFFKIAAVVVFLFCTLTGLIELIVLQRVNLQTHRMLSPEELDLAETIKKSTGPNDRFLTAPVHNHWVMMRAARPILLGFPVAALNYGFLYQQTETDVKTMLAGGHNTLHLLKKYDVHYVVIGPIEKGTFNANESFFQSQFSLAFRSFNYSVYDIKKLRN